VGMLQNHTKNQVYISYQLSYQLQNQLFWCDATLFFSEDSICKSAVWNQLFIWLL